MSEGEKNKKISLLLEDLSSLEDYIYSLFNFFPLPICFVSPLGVILEANPAFNKTSNLPEGEAIGESIEKLLAKEDVEVLIKDTLKYGFLEGREIVFLPAQKKSIKIQVFTRARKDEKGRIVGFFLSFFDLTKIQRVEEELRETQTALLNILEDTEDSRKRAEEERNKTLAIIANFVDGIIMLDVEGRVFLANLQAEAFLGVEIKQIIGKSLGELSDFPNVVKLNNLLNEFSENVFRKELQFNEKTTLEVSEVPISRGKENIGNMVILHDITREKAIEGMKTEFVSLAAHQLRTPLSAIKWTLRMLLDGDLGQITKEQRDFIEKTYNSNERMINLINDLLDVTRIEEGKYLYRPTFCHIENSLQSVVESYKDEFEKKNLTIEFKKPEGKSPSVLIDEEKIKLVVQNLIDNALRYTPKGGKVTVSMGYGKKEIEVSVKDNGVGIPLAEKQRIFSKFFRATNVMRLDTEGSGLGLFITKNIVEAHRGRVWFESEEDKGTTFYFSLPITEEFGQFLKEL